MFKPTGRAEVTGLLSDDVWRVCLPGSQGWRAGPWPA